MYFLTKTFNLYSGSPDKPKVRVLAPTGVATININGTTINSGLSMPLDVNGYILPRLSDYEWWRLVLYKKINSNIADFLRYVTHLAVTKHVSLILGDFNKDSLLNERWRATSLQSLGFTQIFSEPTHIQGACLDHIYIRSNQNSF